jgi:hypothetical protein
MINAWCTHVWKSHREFHQFVQLICAKSYDKKERKHPYSFFLVSSQSLRRKMPPLLLHCLLQGQFQCQVCWAWLARNLITLPAVTYSPSPKRAPARLVAWVCGFAAVMIWKKMWHSGPTWVLQLVLISHTLPHTSVHTDLPSVGTQIFPGEWMIEQENEKAEMWCHPASRLCAEPQHLTRQLAGVGKGEFASETWKHKHIIQASGHFVCSVVL